MTLDEAIIHAEETAEEIDNACEHYETAGVNVGNGRRCAEEYRQLAEWLKLLKQILDSGNCNDCAMLNSQCRYAPRWGEQVRYNCPFYSKER